VSRATGVARSTIGRGLKDLADPGSLSGTVRRPGGGCPTLIEKDPTLLDDLRQLVEPATMGDPMRPLMWVSKSRAKLAATLAGDGAQDHGEQRSKTVGGAEVSPAGKTVRLWKAAIILTAALQFEHINAAVLATRRPANR